MNRFAVTSLCLLGALLAPRVASATKSGELYTSAAYMYGRYETRMRFTAGDGVVSAFFLWKDGSEVAGTFWNELDYEKIGANCTLQTNALYGNPSANHTTKPTVNVDLCAGFHVYSYEWTADYIAWFLDGTEIRRETGATAAAFADNASAGMQVHFNLWPGDASFGGNFNPSILPVHQYVDWVQFSSYANGAFTVVWREDFGGSTAPTGWLTGNWASPKNLSTHDPLNVNFLGGCAVISMTADDAAGPAGAMPEGCEMGGTAGSGAGGTSGNGGTAGAAAGASSSGAAGIGGSGDPAGSGGTGDAGGSNAAGGAGGSGGPSAVGGAGGTPAPTAGGSGASAGGPTGNAGAVAGGSSGAANSGGAAQPGSGGASGGASSIAGTSSTSGTGGTGTGGTEPTAGESAGAGTKTDDASGCGCRVPGSTHSSRHGSGIAATLLLALAGALRRRRVSRAEGLRS